MAIFYSGQTRSTVERWQREGAIPAGVVVHARMGVAASHAVFEGLDEDAATGRRDAVPVVVAIELLEAELVGARRALLGCTDLPRAVNVDRLRVCEDDGRCVAKLATEHARRDRVTAKRVEALELLAAFDEAWRTGVDSRTR